MTNILLRSDLVCCRKGLKSILMYWNFNLGKILRDRAIWIFEILLCMKEDSEFQKFLFPNIFRIWYKIWIYWQYMSGKNAPYVTFWTKQQRNSKSDDLVCCKKGLKSISMYWNFNAGKILRDRAVGSFFPVKWGVIVCLPLWSKAWDKMPFLLRNLQLSSQKKVVIIWWWI